MNKYYAIAIDGPSGAGKSSLARKLAERFSFIYVDTGAIYRTLALASIRTGADRKNENEVMALLPALDISMAYNAAGEQRMYLNGEDVSDLIRTPEVSAGASDVSSHGKVREYLLEMQRKIARGNNVIIDGRDIGTVVLPQAELKIFLTASSEARAERRMKELAQKGMNIPFEEVLRDIERRDRQDSERAAAPLKKAEDAVLVDTSETDFAQSLELLSKVVQERLHLDRKENE